jgi:hypothetical protein
MYPIRGQSQSAIGVQTFCEVDESRLLADGQRPEVAFDGALGPYILGAAMVAAEAFTRLLNAESRDARLEDLADLAEADDTEALIQQPVDMDIPFKELVVVTP